MLDEKAGGYTSETGFNPNSKAAVKSVRPAVAHADSPEVNDADGDSRQDSFVKLQNHLIHVKKEAEKSLFRFEHEFGPGKNLSPRRPSGTM